MTMRTTSNVAVLALFGLLAACGDATGPTSFESGRLDSREVESGSESNSSSQSDSVDDSNSSSSMTAEIRLRCELRTRGRSRISVDGKNLAGGDYRAIVASGANMATSGLQTAVGDEVEFDFDSDPGDIAEGATAISATFIQASNDPHVTASILDAAGNTIVSAAGNCDLRR